MILVVEKKQAKLVKKVQTKFKIIKEMIPESINMVIEEKLSWELIWKNLTDKFYRSHDDSTKSLDSDMILNNDKPLHKMTWYGGKRDKTIRKSRKIRNLVLGNDKFIYLFFFVIIYIYRE